jgi:hypothetical protein
MKNFVKLTLVTLVAFLATAVFAADSTATKLDLHLTSDATIAGTKLGAGDYHVFVTRDGDNAKVTVKDGPKEVVNTTATYKPMTQFTGDVAVARNTSNEVVELQNKKLKGALVFGPAGSTTGNGSSK